MSAPRSSLDSNVRLLKTKVSKHALYGLVISSSAIIIATCLAAYYQSGSLDFNTIINAQKYNAALWILDASPFLFAFWGQYVSSIISYEAGAMVLDQTEDLRQQTKAIENRAMHDSTHDSLTELPNRTLFFDRLTQALTTARKEKSNLAVLLIDLNDFKEINDTLGHFNGDRILKQITARLENVAQKPLTLARLGGDEFAILLPKTSGTSDAIQCAKKVKKSLDTQFYIEGITLDIHAGIGIALFPEHGSDADTLVQRADVAMYAAKQSKENHMVYTSKLDNNSPHKLVIMGELRSAIDSNDLLLEYQPKINMGTNTVITTESLVRWQHERFGLMPPQEFIPLAERTGLIKPLSQWVLNTALAQISQWHSKGNYLGTAVNISTLDLLDVELPDIIAGLIASHEVAPGYLTLEITESAIMKDQALCLQNLHRLTDMGITLSIDDFGTGYSSLSYLSKLPVKEIKIDQSFVTDMLTNPQNEMIVRATIDLAHNLELVVIAEGVADEATYNRLKELGCDIAQGFYISRPIGVNQLETWLNESSWGGNQAQPHDDDSAQKIA